MRSGFSLVEVLVAAVLLSVAILSIAAGGAAALRTVAAAEREQAALVAGMAVIDSLGQRPVAGAGTVRRGSFTVAWSAVDTAGVVRIAVSVRDPAAGAATLVDLEVLAGYPPRRLVVP